MDEIDAALDFKNVSIVAHYIKASEDSLASTPAFRSLGGAFCLLLAPSKRLSEPLTSNSQPQQLQERTRNAQFVIISLRNTCLSSQTASSGVSPFLRLSSPHSHPPYGLLRQGSGTQSHPEEAGDEAPFILRLPDSSFRGSRPLHSPRIYKTDNCTKSVAINPAAFAVGPAAAPAALEQQQHQPEALPAAI